MSSPLPFASAISGPTELLDAIPYLLGFHPERSLVLVGVRGGTLGAAARIDLTDAAEPDTLHYTLAALRRSGAEQVILAVFDDAVSADGVLDDGVFADGIDLPLDDDTLTDGIGLPLDDGTFADGIGLPLDDLPPDDGVFDNGLFNDGMLDDDVFADGIDLPHDDTVADVLLRTWPWAGAVGDVASAARRAGLRLSMALLVSRGQWWSYAHADVERWPVGGQPLATSPSPFAVASACDGVVALPSRSALAATLEPLPAHRRAELEPLVAAAESAAVAATLGGRTALWQRAAVRDLLTTARASNVAGWQPPDDETAARLAVALTTIAVRDEVWVEVDSRRIDGQPLWTDLGRRCPQPYDAAPLFLLGWASWRAGGGTLAGMAAERAVASDPLYSAADLLLAALSQAIDPRTFPRLGDTGLGPGIRDRRRPARRAGAARRRR